MWPSTFFFYVNTVLLYITGILTPHPGEHLFLSGLYQKSAHAWRVQISQEINKSKNFSVGFECFLLCSLVWPERIKFFFFFHSLRLLSQRLSRDAALSGTPL